MHLSEVAAPRDAAGRRITVGDLVRVVGIPDLGNMQREARAETQAVFAHIRGQCKRVAAVDERGNLELSFYIRHGKHEGRHFVWIEPNLVLVQINA